MGYSTYATFSCSISLQVLLDFQQSFEVKGSDRSVLLRLCLCGHSTVYI